MEKLTILVMTCILAVGGCSKKSEKSSQPAENPSGAKSSGISKEQVPMYFMKYVSDGDYDKAFELLAPALADAWTKQKFVDDWKGIKKELGAKWKPEQVGSMSGQSMQGPFAQASYTLDDNWRNPTTLDLTAMPVKGVNRLVRVDIRLPDMEKIPADIKKQADAFVEAMRNKDYQVAREMLVEKVRQQYTVAILEKIGSYFQTSPADMVEKYSRLFANTIWYDVVRFQDSNDPATFVELIFVSGSSKPEIAAISFKQRMSR